jgi:putative transposase
MGCLRGGLPMWTSKNRVRYKRDHLRYPSDVTDEEWAHIGPLIPPAKRGGRKREVDPRDVVDGIMYVLSTGCQWRYIPKDLPPRSTVYRYFCLWGYDGTLDRIHYALYEKCREQAGREASPTAAIIDSQSVKSAEKGGPCIDPPGFDAGKLIKGKKRHILVDTQGLLLHAIVHPADIQDRDGGILLLSTLFGLFPFLKRLFADSAYAGPVFHAALAKIRTQLETEIVKRSDWAKGFVVLPRRWIVERTIAWLNRCRRLAKDWENLNLSGLIFLRFASISAPLRSGAGVVRRQTGEGARHFPHTARTSFPRSADPPATSAGDPAAVSGAAGRRSGYFRRYLRRTDLWSRKE